MGATKESSADLQTEQETLNQSVAGEEDPLAGLIRRAPEPQGSGKGAQIPRRVAVALVAILFRSGSCTDGQRG